jgi:hypothetical protein
LGLDFASFVNRCTEFLVPMLDVFGS